MENGNRQITKGGKGFDKGKYAPSYTPKLKDTKAKIMLIQLKNMVKKGK